MSVTITQPLLRGNTPQGTAFRPGLEVAGSKADLFTPMAQQGEEGSPSALTKKGSANITLTIQIGALATTKVDVVLDDSTSFKALGRHSVLEFDQAFLGDAVHSFNGFQVI